MKANRRGRGPATFSHLRWTSYAIAAGATATGAIPAAEAEIHYSGPVEYRFNAQSTFRRHIFPLSNSAHLMGAFNNIRWIGSDYAYFGVDGAKVSNSLRGPGSVNGLHLLAALPRGSAVSGGNFFPTPFYGDAVMQSLNCANPYWQERGTYYVGFRFNTGGGPQHGWVRIRWAGCNANDFIVEDYAWGDPGDKIKTGQRKLKEDDAAAKTGDPIVGTEGSLGLLALGAVGLTAWRKRRLGAAE